MRLTPEQIATRLFRLSLGVFFIGGFAASCIGLLVPRVRLSLGLDYAGATEIQLASYSSYLLFAIPIAAIVATWGYMRAHALRLGLMAAGSLLLIAGFAGRGFALVLVSLLLMSAGATFLQIASNTAVTVVGDPSRAAVRLTLLQGLNSLGTVAGPLVGAPFIIGAAATGPSPPAIGVPFGAAALVLAVLSGAFFLHRDLLSSVSDGQTHTPRAAWLAVLGDRRLLAGAGAIFAYVGAEVTIGALLTDFLMSPHATGLAPVPAARCVALYWGGAMVGRFVGAGLMRLVSPATLLGCGAVVAAALVAIAVGAHGTVAAAALIGVGLFNSIMYPTIYVLALPKQAEQATPGATVLCMAVVGGAVIPHLTGLLADGIGLVPALLLPGCCYLPVLAFARSCAASHRRS